MVRAGHAAYTNRFHELARLVPHLVTPENKRINRYIYGIVPQIHEIVAVTEPKIIQSAILKARMLTNKAIRNGALKKNTEKRGNNGESGRDGNVRNDNKMSRTERAFATITNPIRNEYTSMAPKCPNYNYHHQPEVPCHLCTNCNRFRHIAKDCRVGPRAVNPLNAKNPTAACRACFECGGTDHYKATCPRLNPALRPGGSRPNQVMAIEGGQGRENNGNPIRGRAFVMGAEEALQDPNIVRGTFTLNNHYDMTLFDFGADYSFVSTTFVPLLYIEPSSLGFSYEIEIASGQLIEIIRMDWLSMHKAKIVYHEKVVRIPLQNDEMLRVLGERPKEKVRHSKSAKVKEQKLKDIVVIRNFSEVFPNDLSGLPPSQEIKFHIDLISGEMTIAKSPYRLTPSKMEKLSSQLRELQDKFLGHVINGNGIHVDPSKIENFSKIAKSLIILTKKSKTFGWGEEQEVTFQTLKDKLCNAPVLALLDEPEDFMVYCDALCLCLGTKSVIYTDHKSLQHIFNQKELNMRQCHWIEFFIDYDCEIRYHPSKATVADALSRKESIKPKRIKYGFLFKGDVRTLITDEAHKLKCLVHLGADKMYYDLRDIYWWSGMKKDIALYVSKCLTYSKIKAEHQRPSDLVQLTKFAHFLPMLEDYKMDRLARLYLNEIFARHGVPILIISDLDSHFALRFWQSMQEVLGTQLDMSTTYDPQTDGQSECTIQTLEDMLRACILDFGGSLDIKDRLKAARDRQKSYTDKKRKPLEFRVGNHVLLKVSPLKGVVRFGKKGKLAPRFVGPFKITERIDPVAYRLRLPEELNGVHDTFHVSNLKKCLADPTL
ncbi:putative reverse transcriptase domain-containing protein [Tanacetum coccineum]